MAAACWNKIPLPLVVPDNSRPYLTCEARDGEGGDEEYRGPASEPLSHDAAQHAGRDHSQGWDARCARELRIVKNERSFLRVLAPNDNDRQVAESRNLAVPICTVQSKTFRNPRTKPRRLLIAEAEILRQFELRDGDGREAAGDS